MLATPSSSKSARIARSTTSLPASSLDNVPSPSASDHDVAPLTETADP